MFTEKDLVFPVSKPKSAMYFKEVLEYENSFLQFLEGEAQPINAAYATYASRIKAGASLAEAEGLAQVIQYIESLSAAKQQNFLASIHNELESALCNVEIAPDETTFFYKDGSIKTVDVVGGLSYDSGDENRRKELVKIVIGKHVTSLANKGEIGTFEDCFSLSSVTFANTVQSIGDYAFANCTTLSEIVIADSITEIGNSAFLNCESLNSIQIPNSVSTIGTFAFTCCTSLASIILPRDLTEINVGMFSECIALASVIIPDSVKVIESGAFQICVALTDLHVPKSVERIGSKAFQKVPHVYYTGDATCEYTKRWGALKLN